MAGVFSTTLQHSSTQHSKHNSRRRLSLEHTAAVTNYESLSDDDEREEEDGRMEKGR